MMKQTVWALAVLTPFWLALALRTGTTGEEPPQRKVAPLSLDGFMDEKLPEASGQKLIAKVDNSACYVCHANYEEEELVVSHAAEEVGCMDCHGDSNDHRNDEDNITPPDTMYPLATIDAMCRECHETHDVSAMEVLQRWQERCPEKTKPSEIACTDCHYQHRLQLRTVRWNKETGELILRDVAGADAEAVD